MKIPRALCEFAARKLTAARARVLANGRDWDLFAFRGPTFVLLRFSQRERPWICFRVTGSTDSWDRGTYAEREDFIMAEIRKLQRPVQGAVARADAADQELQRKFPVLHQHITRQLYEDGSARQPCSFTFYGAAGAFRAFLNDRDSGGSLGVVADSLQACLRALEAELTSESPAWFWRNGGSEHPAKNRGKKA